MNNNETFFNTVTELAKHLEISRKTLYERAKRDGIELNGSYTQEELDLLRLKKGKSVTDTKVNSHLQNETQSKHNETESLDILKSQIAALEQDKDRLYSELESRNKHIDELNKQVDQAQQLHLKTQIQLENEQKKLLDIEKKSDNNDAVEKPLEPNKRRGFWGKLFG
mgnify:CR=1 FL=1